MKNVSSLLNLWKKGTFWNDFYLKSCTQCFTNLNLNIRLRWYDFYCKIWAVTAIYFRRVPYIMANDNKWRCYLLNFKNKIVKNIKKTAHPFYYLKLKCLSIHPSILIFMLQFCWNNISGETKHICYKI